MHKRHEVCLEGYSKMTWGVEGEAFPQIHINISAKLVQKGYIFLFYVLLVGQQVDNRLSINYLHGSVAVMTSRPSLHLGNGTTRYRGEPFN